MNHPSERRSARLQVVLVTTVLLGCAPYDETLLPRGIGETKIDGAGPASPTGGTAGAPGGTYLTGTGASGSNGAGGQVATDVTDATTAGDGSLEDVTGGSGGNLAIDAKLEAALPSLAPILHYEFDETTGPVVADSSGNQHDAACSGTYAWVAGKVGNAISLDGASGYVIIPAGLFASLSEMTVATWVELEQAANWNRIFDFGNRRLNDAGTATSPSVYMFLTPQNSLTHRLRFAMTTSGTSGEQVVDGSDALAIGVWTHVTVSLNAQTASLYVNGLLVRATSPFNLSPTSLGATMNNWIGRSLYPPDPYFKGKFDDFRVYDRVLTAAEVASVVLGQSTLEH